MDCRALGTFEGVFGGLWVKRASWTDPADQLINSGK